MFSRVCASRCNWIAARCGGLPGGGVPSGTASASSPARLMMSCTESSGVAAGDTNAIGSRSVEPSKVMRVSKVSPPRSTMRAGKVGVSTQPKVAPLAGASARAFSAVRPPSPCMLRMPTSVACRWRDRNGAKARAALSTPLSSGAPTSRVIRRTAPAGCRPNASAAPKAKARRVIMRRARGLPSAPALPPAATGSPPGTAGSVRR